MSATYHIRIKKEYAAAVIEDLQKMDAVELLKDKDEDIDIPQWQIDEVRRRVAYYDQHPNELIPWAEVRKQLKF